MSGLFNKMIGDKQYHFQPLEFAEETGYHVDVKDAKCMRWEFRMLYKGDQWNIEGEDLPDWIPQVTGLLTDAINEHE